MQFWNELEGQEVDGLYPLRRLVRSEGRTAWFETTAEGSPATISLTESLTDAEEVTKRLQSAQRIEHRNLLAIRKVGRARLENTLFVYAIMEHSDQTLSDILREQALSKEETREVAESLVAALTSIHQKGLAHGRVEAASVLAVGDSIKLRSDCLQSPGSTLAGDISGLGATLFQALTQRKPASADDPQINRISSPFAEIVRNTLSGRWTLAQVAGVLKPPPAPAPQGSPLRASPPLAPNPHPSSSAASASTSPVSTSAPAPSRSVAPPPTAQPRPSIAESLKQRPAEPVREPGKSTPWLPPPLLRDERDQDDPSPRRPMALYAVLALALLLILGWLIFRPKQKAPSSHATHPVLAPAPAPDSPNSPPHSPMSAGNAPNEGSSAANSSTDAAAAAQPRAQLEREKPDAAIAASTVPASASIWRVVAYTYRRQDQAQHKADEVKLAHPDLQPVVFLPPGQHARYLVTIGGPMDRQHAIALRGKARQMGLPADTYAQNFSH